MIDRRHKDGVAFRQVVDVQRIFRIATWRKTSRKEKHQITRQ